MSTFGPTSGTMCVMDRRRGWIQLTAVAAAYVVAFLAIRRVIPFDLASPWFVLVAMVCFLGLAFVAQPLVMIRMPRPLRRIRAWEMDGRVYRALGVPAYGRLLRRTALRLFNRDVYLQDGLRDTRRVGAELEAAEASHFWAAALVAPYMIHAALEKRWIALLGILLAQLLINLYPVMHLRLSRYRLDRLVSRRSRQRLPATLPR